MTYLNLFKFYLSVHNTDTQAPSIGLIVVDLCHVLGFPSQLMEDIKDWKEEVLNEVVMGHVK